MLSMRSSGVLALDWRPSQPEELAARPEPRRATRSDVGHPGSDPLGAIAILAGTAATAPARTRAGRARRTSSRGWTSKGVETLTSSSSSNGGSRRCSGSSPSRCGSSSPPPRRDERRRPRDLLCGLLALQGVVAARPVPARAAGEIVWLHASLAAVTWLAIVWAVVPQGSCRRALPAAGQAARPRPAR